MTGRPTVVVTGVAGAVGGAVASAFAGGGYGVIGIDRTAGQAVTLEADLRYLTDVQLELVRRYVSQENCAGLVVSHGTLDISRDSLADLHLDATLSDNLLSFMYLARLLRETALQRSREYRLVTVSSLASRTGANDPAYAASKAAVTAATLSIARQRQNGILACIIELGPVESPMNTSKASHAAYYLSRSPIGRLVTPDEVGDLIWSIWPHMHCLNGSIIPVDGGIRIS